MGINLVEGFNESRADVSENAVWIGEKLYPVGRAHFSWNDADPYDAWRIKTEDGSVDLRFAPIHIHREERDLKLIRSHFVQPVGTF